jgi:protein TonB
LIDMSSIAVYSTRTLQADYLEQAINDPQTSRRMPMLMRWTLVIIAAVTVNTLIIWALYSLNAIQLTFESRSLPVVTVMLNQQQSRQQEDQPQREPETEPEPLTVSLDMPDPTPPTPQFVALDLKMAMPEMSPILVSVMTPPTAAPQPVQRAAPQPTPVPATPKTYDSDQVDNPPRELSGNPKPAYPERELNRGRQGAVTVKLLINERGRVEDVALIESQGSSKFVDSVMQVIGQYRFTPAKHEGRVVKVWGIKTIRFEIGE